MRWPIVVSLVRKPRAISAVVRPPTSRSVSAARDSGVSEGWQDRKTSRRTSSSMWSTWSSRSGIRASSPPPACSSSATLRRSVSARRKWSTPRRLAVVISQADGLSGIPDTGHCSSAATSASCARSSARSTSRVIRARAPTRRADSARHVAITTPEGPEGPEVVVRPCRHAASVVSRRQSPGASGPSDTWRSVETTVTSGQCLACSSAKSRWSATASSRLAYSISDQPPTTSLPSA